MLILALNKKAVGIFILGILVKKQSNQHIWNILPLYPTTFYKYLTKCGNTFAWNLYFHLMKPT